MAETLVQKHMRLLGITEEEALQVIADDKAIDRGERMSFDLDKETEKQAKKYANVGTRKSAEKVTKTRKENPTKATVITEIFKFLNENAEISAENVVILNKERQISFKIGDNSFELTLTQKRKPKN